MTILSSNFSPSNLIKWDKRCDYLPIVSTFTNCFHLYYKFQLSLEKEPISPKSHYYSYVKNKNFYRCITLLIPVFGNIVIGIYDLLKKKTGPEFTGIPINDKENINNEENKAKTDSVSKENSLTHKTDSSVEEDNPNGMTVINFDVLVDPSQITDMALYEKGLEQIAKQISTVKKAIEEIKKERIIFKFLNKDLKENADVIFTVFKKGKKEIAQSSNGICVEIKKNGMYVPDGKPYNPINDISKEVILALIEKNAGATILPHLSFSEYEQDSDLIEAACKQDPKLAEYFPQSAFIPLFKKGKCIEALKYFKGKGELIPLYVAEAIKQNGLALQYVPDASIGFEGDLKNNYPCVRLAWKQNPESLKFAGKEATITLLQKFGESLQYASEDHKNDIDVVLAAVKNRGLSLQFANEKLRDNEEVVLAAIQQDPYALEYASNKLRDDPKIVMTALKGNWISINFASDKCKKDPMITAFKNENGISSFDVWHYFNHNFI